MFINWLWSSRVWGPNWQWNYQKLWCDTSWRPKLEDFDKSDKHKYDARSYIDGVPKSPNGTFIDDGDIHVDVESVVDGHVPHHDEPVKEDSPEPTSWTWVEKVY